MPGCEDGEELAFSDQLRGSRAGREQSASLLLPSKRHSCGSSSSCVLDRGPCLYVFTLVVELFCFVFFLMKRKVFIFSVKFKEILSREYSEFPYNPFTSLEVPLSICCIGVVSLLQLTSQYWNIVIN